METTQQDSKQLMWKDEYSVGVKEIDDQHKELFVIINHLIEVINAIPREEEVAAILGKIVEYKIAHFATEEKYFHEFGFEGTAEHEEAHQTFNEKLAETQAAFQGDTMGFAFAAVDFLEDWLIEHLMTMDQKYKQCFSEHGLS